MENKVKTLEELKPILEDHKKQGKKIVHCHGVFDLIHFGHLQHFLAAKKQGDILVVTLTPDRFIQKGPERPFFNEDIRLKHLSYIEFIDYVSLNNWPTAVETIKIIQPDIYAKGKEVLANKDVDKLNEKGGKKSNLAAEEEIVQSFGGKLYLTDEMTFSSSRIINSITSALSEDTKEYLRGFRKEFNTEQILEVLDSLKDLRVLVLGDAIFDDGDAISYRIHPNGDIDNAFANMGLLNVDLAMSDRFTRALFMSDGRVVFVGMGATYDLDVITGGGIHLVRIWP